VNYLANTAQQQKEMLDACSIDTVDDLFATIPESLRCRKPVAGKGKSELELLSFFEERAADNYSHLINFIGAGFYDHFIPSAVDALASRSEFYTAYTPYQPELSQGTLQSIYEYQTHICRLTGLQASNASLYDGGTALFEACQMAIAATGRNRIVVDGGVNPIYRKMIYSYAANLNIDFHEIPVSHGQSDRARVYDAVDGTTAAVVLQNPNFFGVIDNHRDIVEHTHRAGGLVCQSVNPIALSVLTAPGEIGVDIATGEGQSLGNPLSFGGPYLGFMATTKKLVRKMPGRIAGRTVDTNGKEGFVLTLQAREQHIRRAKATSNICTNQGLCALRANIFLSLLGPRGLNTMALQCRRKSEYAKSRLKTIPGVTVMESSPTFNEFTVRLPIDAGECVGRMIERGFAAGFPLGRYYPEMSHYLLVCVTEKRTKCEIGQFAEHLEEVLCH